MACVHLGAGDDKIDSFGMLRCTTLNAAEIAELSSKPYDTVLICSDGIVFNAHEDIISKGSDYFRSGLQYVPVNKEDKKVFNFSEVSTSCMFTCEVISSVMNWVYGRAVPVTKSLLDTLRAASYLLMSDLEKACVEHIMHSEDITRDCIKYYQWAHIFMVEPLKQAGYKHLLKNLPAVYRESEEDMLNLDYELLHGLLEDNHLNISDEVFVWKIIQKWIKVNPGERRIYIPSLLQTCRMGLIPREFFYNQIVNDLYIRGSCGCDSFMMQAVRFFSSMENLEHIDVEVTTPALAMPRVPHEVLFAVGGWSSGAPDGRRGPTNAVESYDIRADRWVDVKEADPYGARCYHGVAIIGRHVYLFGGFNGYDYYSSCRSFNTETREWREIAPMRIPRCYVSVALLHDKIYAMGGHNGSYRERSVERYDPARDTWTSVAAMHTRRSDATACLFNDKIYIFGGFTGEVVLDTVEVYDAATDSWMFLPSMSTSRSGVSCAVHQEHIYVLGGSDGERRLGTMERYSPREQYWTVLPPMGTARSNFGVSVIENCIYVAGGFNGTTTIPDVECYDIDAQLWFVATPMGLDRSALSLSRISCLDDVSGYIYQHRENLLEERRLDVRRKQQPQT